MIERVDWAAKHRRFLFDYAVRLRVREAAIALTGDTTGTQSI